MPSPPHHHIGKIYDFAIPQQQTRAAECVAHTVRVGDLFLNRIVAICHQHGLSGLEANVLSVLLNAEEPLPPYVISERLLVTRGAITKVLDTLAERGLVQRIAHQQDRRMLLIELMDEGLRVLEQYKPDLSRQSAQWVDTLNEEEQEMLIHLLKKLQPPPETSHPTAP